MPGATRRPEYTRPAPASVARRRRVRRPPHRYIKYSQQRRQMSEIILAFAPPEPPCKTVTCYLLLHLVRGEFEAAFSAACRLGWNSEFCSDLHINAHLLSTIFSENG